MYICVIPSLLNKNYIFNKAKADKIKACISECFGNTQIPLKVIFRLTLWGGLWFWLSAALMTINKLRPIYPITPLFNPCEECSSWSTTQGSYKLCVQGNLYYLVPQICQKFCQYLILQVICLINLSLIWTSWYFQSKCQKCTLSQCLSYKQHICLSEQDKLDIRLWI